MKRKLVGLLALAVALAALCAASAWADQTLATAKTPLSSASSAQIGNMELACAAIDGTVVADGGYFSFNDTVGPRTSSYGYKNAPNGRGVKVTGGGVGQVASTLYLALKKLDGVSFEEKKTYGSKYVGDYVESSRDAILVDYKAGTDFSFYSDGGDDLRIEMWVSGDYVHCQLTAPSYAGGTDKSAGPGYASIYVDGSEALQDNISLAAQSIYDTALERGDLFSFNDIVGPRTERYGYARAVNGRGVKVCGGGVAQVASVLYMAVRDMDCVEIVSRTTYGRNYNQAYVDSADDAIAVDYNNDLDFSFRYTGYDTLNIYTYLEDDTLTCEIVEN